MSPRAAWRLEALGFSSVYGYTAGKVDWLATGHRTEWRGPGEQRVLEALDMEPLTCSPADLVTSVIADMRERGADLCVVVNDQRIIQGRLRLDKLPDPPTGSVKMAMELGPAAIRLNEPPAATRQRMSSRGVRSLIATTPEGLLLATFANVDEGTGTR